MHATRKICVQHRKCLLTQNVNMCAMKMSTRYSSRDLSKCLLYFCVCAVAVKLTHPVVVYITADFSLIN